MPQSLHSLGKSLPYLLLGGLVGPTAGLNIVEKRKIL
jgi:hypothetical protein